MAAKLDIREIRKSLEEVKRKFPEINKKLKCRRDDFTDEVMENMISAYKRLNDIVGNGTDIFKDKNLHMMFDLNSIVLYGPDWKRRYEYHQAIVYSQNRFYRYIEPILKWNTKHEDSGAMKRAAETYVGVLSSPQLFNEGNHRTGSLIASYILLMEGKPPFVLSVDNAEAYFNPSSEIKFSDKRKKSDGLFKLPKYKKRFKRFLEEYTDKRYII